MAGPLTLGPRARRVELHAAARAMLGATMCAGDEACGKAERGRQQFTTAHHLGVTNPAELLHSMQERAHYTCSAHHETPTAREAARLAVREGGCEAGSARGRLRVREAARLQDRSTQGSQRGRKAARVRGCEAGGVRGCEAASVAARPQGMREAARLHTRLQGGEATLKAARLRGCARGCGATTRPTNQGQT